MDIDYSLITNHLTPDPNDQKAVVIPKASLDIEDLIIRIIRRGTTLTETDVRAVLNLFMQEACQVVVEGNFLNTPLVNIRPSIQGVFDDPTDTFDSKRHLLTATVSIGTLLTDAMATATVSKQAGSSERSPDIVMFLDSKTNTNTLASVGGIGTIVGTELKFDINNAAEGVFFKDQKSGTVTKVVDYAQRSTNKLVFIIPASLVAGNYTLTVVKAYTKNAVLRSDNYQQTIVIK